MDIGAAQDLFGRTGELSRIDVRLRAGRGSRSTGCSAWHCRRACVAAEPGDADPAREQPVARLPRQPDRAGAGGAVHRRLPGVLGAVAVSVAQRAPAVRAARRAGADAARAARLVLAESAAAGHRRQRRRRGAGRGAGGAGAARAGRRPGRRLLRGVAPRLQWSAPAALGYGLLGVAGRLVGGWLPARRARARCRSAQALKGLGDAHGARPPLAGPGLLLVALASPWPCCRPWAACRWRPTSRSACCWSAASPLLPPLVRPAVRPRCAPRVAHRVLPLLAVRARAPRARHRHRGRQRRGGQPGLAVALTVMVASFRDSVARWLDVLLPADLYVRTRQQQRGRRHGLPRPGAGARPPPALPGVQRVATQRVRPLQLDPARPPWRCWRGRSTIRRSDLPLVGAPRRRAAGPGAGLRERGHGRPVRRARRASPCRCSTARWACRRSGAAAASPSPASGATTCARSAPSLLRPAPTTGAHRRPPRQRPAGSGCSPAPTRPPCSRPCASAPAPPALLEFASAREIRATSLRIFDRSFAVTYWLQAVAIGIGLFGVAASFSAQVLARRKEFGLLAHLGLTRRQILGGGGRRRRGLDG